MKTEEAPKPKPVFKPKFKKPETESPIIEEVKEEMKTEEAPKPKPVFKPKFKRPDTES
jgi:hypothetical protein